MHTNLQEKGLLDVSLSPTLPPSKVLLSEMIPCQTVMWQEGVFQVKL